VKFSILVIDDEPATLFGFSRYLKSAGYAIAEASCLAEAGAAISAQRFDAIILDLHLPDGNGIEWITKIREDCPDTAIVVITGRAEIPVAVDAMRRGADNFLTKPVSMSDLEIFLRKSLELSGLRRKDLARQRLTKEFSPFFGESTAMRSVMELASVASENDSAVLLQGDTGTGKGVLAKWIHEQSCRKTAPFVEINCSALKGDLLSSELFGHVRGAFTSAVQDRQGLIEIADGGTLFLDEIADMDLQVQAQFLKVIEEKCYRRLGDVGVRRSNFRLIAATNRDLEKEVREGRFRNDLFYRINLFPVFIPPLKKRIGDLPDLSRHILHLLGSPGKEISSEVMSLLSAYSWPGNIRELKNVLERALLISRGAALQPGHFPGLTHAYQKHGNEKDGDTGLQDIEREYIAEVMNRSGGNMKKAADMLNTSRATLYRKLKKYRLS
jgi:DNA-binding NtrC family response regulator